MTTALVVIMHQTAAMMVCPMAAIKVLPVQLPSDVVVFGPADMAAGAILHFVQTLTFVPVEMTVGQCPAISAVDMPLFPFQPAGYRECDFTATDSLVDAPGLSIIPGIKTISRPGR